MTSDFFCAYWKIHYLCNMKPKLHLDWKKALIFLLVSAGLIYITQSALMSIGIILLLFVADNLLADWEYRRKTKRIFDDMRKEHEEKEKQDSRDKWEESNFRCTRCKGKRMYQFRIEDQTFKSRYVVYIYTESILCIKETMVMSLSFYWIVWSTTWFFRFVQ